MDMMTDIVDELSKEIAGERELIYNLLYVLGGKFVLNKNPLSFHTVLNSESGSGKDFILNKIMGMFEYGDDYEDYTRISARSLDYLHCKNPSFNWDGKFLVLHDVEEEILNSPTMKVFLTEGSRTAIVDNGDVKIRNIKGRPIVLMTTAYSDPNLEQLRRVNIMNLDESSDQTKRIMLFQSQLSKEQRDKENSINYLKLNTILKEIKPCNVIIPFAEKLVNKIDCNNIHIRTFFPKILDFIKASAAINQKDRKIQFNNVIAEDIDYENIRHIINSFSHGTTFKPLSIARKDMLDLIKTHFENQPFSVRDIVNYSGKSYDSARRLLKNLIEEKYIEVSRQQDPQTLKYFMEYRLIQYAKVKLPSILEG